MTARLMCSALALALLPGHAMALCGGRHEQVVECDQGESRDPVNGQCTKPVSS